MSRMMLRSNGKPPLAIRSPIRLRSRTKALPPSAPRTDFRSPPGSIMKSKPPNRNSDMEKPELRPEYYNISCELQALAKMVYQELGSKNSATCDGDVSGAQRSPTFERGKFYDEYSARRNERLRRKKGEIEGYEKKPAYDLGVRVESAMKRESSKYSSRGKMAAVAAATTPQKMTSTLQTPRYSLRSVARKESKKPPLPTMNLGEKSAGVAQRKASVSRRGRKV